MHAAASTPGLDTERLREGAAGARAARPPIATVSPFDILLTAAVAAFEAGMLALVKAGVPLWPMVIGHGAILAVVIAALYVQRQHNRDLTASLLMLVAVATSGPIGAAVSLLALVWLRRPSLPSGLLADWYRRISLSATTDEETLLAERVAAGRVIDTASAAPPSFVGVMDGGPLDERQRALGLVARLFHPGYLPTLTAALASEEPVVRVQAAAVAAYVRPRLASEAARLIGASKSASGVLQQIDTARDLERMICSGLLDKEVEDAARSAAMRLVAGIDLFQVPLTREADAAADALESLLAERRLLARLRLLRLRRRCARTGAGRIRPRRGKSAAPPAPVCEIAP